MNACLSSTFPFTAITACSRKSPAEYAPTAYRPGSALLAARNSATNFRFAGFSNAAEYQPDDSTPITSSPIVFRIASSTVVMPASTATLPRSP